MGQEKHLMGGFKGKREIKDGQRGKDQLRKPPKGQTEKLALEVHWE